MKKPTEDVAKLGPTHGTMTMSAAAPTPGTPAALAHTTEQSAKAFDNLALSLGIDPKKERITRARERGLQALRNAARSPQRAAPELMAAAFELVDAEMNT
jgi:hypothetical protein